MIQTSSLCPVCYQDIPAIIHINEPVMMVKDCPVHGRFTGVVESDLDWWIACRKAGCKSIYDGYLIDVTDRCNMKCKYCYHGNGVEDISADAVIKEAKDNLPLAPIILTGGEPTLHPELPRIVRECSALAETWVLTNGVKLAKEPYLDELCGSGLLYNGILLAGLSFHKESKGKDMRLIELCRTKGIKLGTAFWVIDDLAQIDEALSVFEANKDVILSMRIKAASNLWAEKGVHSKIFVSDMLKYLFNRGPTKLRFDKNNKVSFANVMHKGLYVMLISWYDRFNIDLNDIDCPPYYKAKDGQIYDLVKACLKNNRPLYV